MKLTHTGIPYLSMTIPGLFAPLPLRGAYLALQQVGVGNFLQSIYANAAAGAVAAGLMVSALAFIDRPSRGMWLLWLYPLLTFDLGLSLGLPVYLYCRARTQAHD